jgi:hypothetical protein
MGVLVSCPMKWLTVSLVIQIILAAYFQVVLWFPLGSWNDQPGKRLITLLSTAFHKYGDVNAGSVNIDVLDVTA